jgi:hypothetical protein
VRPTGQLQFWVAPSKSMANEFEELAEQVTPGSLGSGVSRAPRVTLVSCVVCSVSCVVSVVVGGFCFALCAVRTVGVAAVSLAIHLAPVAADCQVEFAGMISEHAKGARAMETRHAVRSTS